MRVSAFSPTFLLSLFTFPTTFAYTPTNSQASLHACVDASCTSCTTIVYSGFALDTCEFSNCTTFKPPGVAHSMYMQRPHRYITLPSGVLQHPLYGNVTCLMYATNDCTGTSELETIPTPSESGCGASSVGWKSFECRFGLNCS